MTIATLKANLHNVMPILDANLAAAYKEYMDGSIAHGAYEYVRERHVNALTVLDSNTMDVNAAYQICALLAIDLRCGLAEMTPEAQAQEKIEAWWQCYRDAGYTAIHKFFKSPMLPA